MHGAVHRTSLTLALCACAVAPSDGLPDGCVAGDAPTLDVGAGASEYTALDDGDTVELVHGAQGGFHVVIALDGQFLDVAEGSRVPGQITATIDGPCAALCHQGELLAVADREEGNWRPRVVLRDA